MGGGSEVHIRLISNFDFASIPKIADRRFALAATKSSVSTSSLSKVMIGRMLSFVVSCRVRSRLLKRSRLHYGQPGVMIIDEK